MENSRCKRNSLALQFPVHRNSASVSTDHKHPRFSCRRFHFHAAKFRVNTDYLVRNFLCKIQLMKGHDHSHLFFQHHFFQNGKQFQFMTDIQKRCRFIQDDNLRFLADGARQKNPLALSVTDRCEIPVFQIPGMYHLHGIFNFFLILRRKNSESSGIWITSGRHHILTGHKFRTHTLGEHYGQFPGNLFVCHAAHLFLFQIYGSTDQGKLSCDTLQDCGFSGAVGTDQCEDFSFIQLNIDLFDQRFSVIPYGQLIRIKKI